MQSKLDSSVQYLKSVGPKRAESFQKIGIATIRDLLFYFPTRYLDRRTIINSVKAAKYLIDGYEGEVTILGKVINSEVIRYGKKQLFKVSMKDNAGFYECVWFQGVKFFKDKFQPGEQYAISAKPVLTKYGNLQFAHPDFDKLDSEESKDFLNTGKIIPFYRLPRELKAKNIGDLSLRKIISFAVENFAEYLEETLPQNIIDEQNLLNIIDAVRTMHSPKNNEALTEAKNRFIFEELFYIECLVALRKHSFKNNVSGIKFRVAADPIKNFLSKLPFELTEAQLKVLGEIRKDMESDKPMSRMLQGDVGSGKTVVALIAMLIAAENGYQAALMAPTEILANQHFKNISNLISHTRLKANLLIGGQKKSEKQKNLNDIKLKESDIIVGTHALFEDNVDFNKLGLVIIDEQHRFGVEQRFRLMKKGASPDVLVMTATPIPRTLSMTVYGDLDLSIIDEMPKNRLPIITTLRGEGNLPDIYQFIKDKISEGYQSFVVYPLVEESAKLELKAAEEYYEKLKSTHFSDINLGMIHGKMKWNEKEEIMLKFAAKEFDVLISTTVIEVGIDIPDVNIIVINDAFRFGLSQLHQLRGRVGRSDKQAYCILISNKPVKKQKGLFEDNFEYMSKAQIEKYKSQIRMQAMTEYSSGFKLAEIDLKLRGPGDIFGTKQSGMPELKYSDLARDSEILIEAKKCAFETIEKDIKLNSPSNQLIKDQLKKYYSEQLKFSYIG
jgi:ATP-dependent DNA helicase RecG